MSTEYSIYRTLDCEITAHEISGDICLLFKNLNSNEVIKLTEYVMPDDIAAIAVKMLYVVALNQSVETVANVLEYNHGFSRTVRNDMERVLNSLGGFNV